MITRLQITIEPRHLGDDRKELRVEVEVDGFRHVTVAPFYDDDFESRFDRLMKDARLEIIRLVEAHRKRRT